MNLLAEYHDLVSVRVSTAMSTIKQVDYLDVGFRIRLRQPMDSGVKCSLGMKRCRVSG